jgi:hypothetical protein
VNTKLTDEHHVALHWVETEYPGAHGAYKAALIRAYGAGVTRGFAEVQEIVGETIEEIKTDPAAFLAKIGVKL